MPSSGASSSSQSFRLEAFCFEEQNLKSIHAAQHAQHSAGLKTDAPRHYFRHTFFTFSKSHPKLKTLFNALNGRPPLTSGHKNVQKKNAASHKAVRWAPKFFIY
eukprot:scaffold114036_cov18-Tisochrysis_lutea.AAC.4